MASYLAEHPEILFSEPKETNFFNFDHQEQRLFKDLADYQQAAFPQADRYALRGDGSVWYLFSKVALDEILKVQPEAKIVVMLRNPVELVYALHSTFLLGLLEDQEDFETAWAWQADRAQGRKVPKHCPEPKFLQYGSVGKLGEQLEPVLQKVDPERLHLIWYDDFKSDTQREYQKLLRFLGAPDDGRTEFIARNTAARTKNSSLSRLLTHLAQNRSLNRLKRALGFKMGKSIIANLKEKNRERTPRKPLSEGMRKQLQDYFLADIEKLEKLSGRDLSAWKE